MFVVYFVSENNLLLRPIFGRFYLVERSSCKYTYLLLNLSHFISCSCVLYLFYYRRQLPCPAYIARTLKSHDESWHDSGSGEDQVGRGRFILLLEHLRWQQSIGNRPEMPVLVHFLRKMLAYFDNRNATNTYKTNLQGGM